MDARFIRTGDVRFALAHAAEECGELCAALGKSLRWGLDSVNPDLPPSEQETNAAWVRREMTDLRGALDRLEAELEAVAVPLPTKMLTPDDVHPSHDVRDEGIYVSDPVCQRCGASVYGTPNKLLLECNADAPDREQSHG